MAENCWVMPAGVPGTIGLNGVGFPGAWTSMAWRRAVLTVRVVLPTAVPKVALMVIAPAETAVARPPGLVIVTTEVSEDVQVT